MRKPLRSLFSAIILVGPVSSLYGHLFFTGGTNSYLTPSFRGGANAEYSHWDVFYAPHTAVNYPDIAAPNGTKQTRSAAGFPADVLFSPADPLAFWHVNNPTLLQTGGVASGAFIIGPGTAGNIYSFAGPTSFEIADTTPFASLGTVNFQWQTDGTPMDTDTLKLVFNNGTTDIYLSPTNSVIEYKSASSAFGFAPMVRASVQWDLTGLNITNYKIVFSSASSSMSFQEAILDIAAVYTEVTPAARTWNAAGVDANWSTAANWLNNAISSPGSTVTFGTGSNVVVDSNRMVGELNISTPGDFTIGGASTLTLNTGINVNTPGNHTIGAPVFMGGFNLNYVAEGATLTFDGPVGNNSANSGGGFYKYGDGMLVLAANNTFTGGVMLDGGTLRIAHDGALNATTPNGVGFVAGTPPDTKLQLNGHSITIAGLTTNTDALGTDPGPPIVENASSTPVVLTVDASAAGTFGGILRDGVGGGALALVKTGVGTQTMSGPNSYTGSTIVRGGLITIASDVSLGAVPTSAAVGSVVLDGGGLGATGTLVLNANRGIAIGPDAGSGSGTLDASTAGGTIVYGGSVADRGAGSGRLVKSGPGTLMLTGANTYTGGTSVTGGFLSIDTDTRLGPVPASATAGHLVLNGGGLYASESFTLESNRGIAVGPGTGSGIGLISVAPSKTLSYGGVIANGGGTGGLTKTGAGVLELTGSNTYTGPTALTGGTLLLNFEMGTAVSNIVAASSALQGVGGTLLVRGKISGTTSQTFGSTAISAGHTKITVDSNGGGGTTVVLGALTRTAGATVNFTLPAVGAVTTSTSTLTNDVLTSAASPNGVAYATVGNADWATVSGGNIVALSAYETSANPADWAATENVALSANANVVTTSTVNTLKLTDGADVTIGSGQMLTIGAAGLLVTGSGASEITGGTLRGSGGTTKELVIFQNNTANAFTINSVIANNSAATGLTKTGDGTLVLAGANTYTGVTRITGGLLSIASLSNGGSASPLGQATNAASNIVLDNATLRYTGVGSTSNRGFTLGINGGTIESSGSGVLNLNGTNALSFSGSNTARTFTLAGTNTGDNNFSGAVNNNGSGATSIVKDGPSTWMLSGNNGFTGGLTVNEGTFKLGNTGALNTATPNRVAFAAGAPLGTKLQLNGFNSTISALDTDASVPGAPMVENGGATNATLTLAIADRSTFAGTLRDGPGAGTFSLAKLGHGTFELAGANSYTGPTTINAGTLLVSGSISGSVGVSVSSTGTLAVEGTIDPAVPVTVNDGGTLLGSGTFGDLTLNEGGLLAPGSSVGTLEGDSLLWNGGAILRLELGVSSAASDHLTLDGALTKGTGAGFLFEFQDFGVVAGTTYELVMFTSTNFVPADFTFTSDGGVVDGFFTVDENSVNFIATVPEPSSVVLLLAATAGLGLKRLRRRA